MLDLGQDPKDGSFPSLGLSVRWLLAVALYKKLYTLSMASKEFARRCMGLQLCKRLLHFTTQHKIKQTSFYNAAQNKTYFIIQCSTIEIKCHRLVTNFHTYSPWKSGGANVLYLPHRVRWPRDVAELLRSGDICVTEVALLLPCVVSVGWENQIR